MAPSTTRWWVFLLLISAAATLHFDPEQVGFNLNENETATDPLDYWGEWTNHSFQPSPNNWRIPFYSLFLDRFVNGDPTNDDANGTQFEHDLTSTQMRHGGDVLGLMDSFDYIQGMGVKVCVRPGSRCRTCSTSSRQFI
jgi:alpha-1,3-glucan synthase